MMIRQSGLLTLIFLVFFWGCSEAEMLSTGQDADDFVQQYIDDHDIMVFAKSTCKYCKNSRKILDILQKQTGMKGWNARVVNLDYMSTDGPKIHEALLKKTGQTTVPNVFLSGQHVGGNTELTSLYKSGKLIESLKKIAKAKFVKQS